MACFIPLKDRSNLRVCTNEECRYKLCGITVAPIIPIAMYKAAVLGKEGTRPFTISPASGFAKNISAKNESPIMLISPMMKASIFFMPLFIRNSSKNVSSMVMLTPHSIGSLNNRLSPMAIPNTSARSQAAIATSASRYKKKFTALGYVSRDACARSLRVTIPKRALRLCSNSAIMLLISSTHIRV